MRAHMAERLVLNKQRLEEEHANLLEAQAKVSHNGMQTSVFSCKICTQVQSESDYARTLLSLAGLLEFFPLLGHREAWYTSSFCI